MPRDKESLRKVLFTVADYVDKVLKSDSSLQDREKEALASCRDSLSGAFKFNVADLSDRSAFLPNSFDLEKVVLGSGDTSKEKTAATTLSDEDRAKAEELKKKGNQKLAEKDYASAAQFYGEAIALDGSNAVYYSNRAAAYSLSGEHESSLADARKAIDVDENYSKGWGRLGHAAYCLGNYQEAVDAYKRGIELEPLNASFKKSLETAMKKLEQSGEKPGDAQLNSAASPGANPLAGLANMPNMGDMASMFSDPNFMNMASNLMSDPNFAQMASNLMSNPNLSSQLSSMFGNTSTEK